MSDARPHTSRLRAAATVAVCLALVGAVVGALWAVLAPPVRGVIALTKSGERVHAYLGAEADHFFVAAFLMLGMLAVVAVVATVLVWQWQAHRGPAMVVALTLGAVAGAALATTIGAVLVAAHYDVVDINAAPVSPEHRVHYFTQAASVFFGHSPAHIAATLLSPAATAALVYALLAVSTARDDLGGYPPVDPVLMPAPAAFAPVTTDGGAASGR